MDREADPLAIMWWQPRWPRIQIAVYSFTELNNETLSPREADAVGLAQSQRYKEGTRYPREGIAASRWPQY